jgi:hypothetical protein
VSGVVDDELELLLALMLVLLEGATLWHATRLRTRERIIGEKQTIRKSWPMLEWQQFRRGGDMGLMLYKEGSRTAAGTLRAASNPMDPDRVAGTVRILSQVGSSGPQAD